MNDLAKFRRKKKQNKWLTVGSLWFHDIRCIFVFIFRNSSLEFAPGILSTIHYNMYCSPSVFRSSRPYIFANFFYIPIWAFIVSLLVLTSFPSFPSLCHAIPTPMVSNTYPIRSWIFLWRSKNPEAAVKYKKIYLPSPYYYYFFFK